MQFPVKAGVGVSVKTECAILPIFESRSLAPITANFDRSLRGRIRRLIRSRDASPRIGQTALLRDVGPTGAKNILLVGCGKKLKFDSSRLAQAAGAAADALSQTGIRNATNFLSLESKADSYSTVRALALASRFAVYRFTEQKSKPDPEPRLSRMTFAMRDDSDLAAARRGASDATAIAYGVDIARNLGNRPPNVCTPSHLAKVARDLGKEHSKLTVKIVSEDQIRRLGMGAFLSVTAGADAAAKLIVMQYRGASADTAPVALCGKGITFDTGGISLKPPPKMDEMKFDMCGAAAVIGTMASVAELELETNVVAIIPACENMPSGNATRPGDIVTSMSGQTIEILNTDAEGRLILCDALTYARQFDPDCIIDVATLTGACVIALGGVYTGVFSSNQELSAELLEAGQRAVDEGWPLPVTEAYGESLRSNFADFANAGVREGGASIAAQFLSRFVDDTPWAHLDIAGVAWQQGTAKGATGRPVGLLIDFLLNRQNS